MAEPFLSEIKIVSFDFAPRGWAQCDGQILPISQNQALYSLLGTTYGGDGRVNFGLPDLRSRTPLHVGGGHTLGQRGGELTHALAIGEIPQHAHAVAASSTASGGSATPNGNVLGGANNVYHAAGGPTTTLRPDSVTSGGGGQAHQNAQPYLGLNFCIALQGLFPSRN